MFSDLVNNVKTINLTVETVCFGERPVMGEEKMASCLETMEWVKWVVIAENEVARNRLKIWVFICTFIRYLALDLNKKIVLWNYWKS